MNFNYPKESEKLELFGDYYHPAATTRNFETIVKIIKAFYDNAGEVPEELWVEQEVAGGAAAASATAARIAAAHDLEYSAPAQKPTEQPAEHRAEAGQGEQGEKSPGFFSKLMGARKNKL